MYKSLKHTKPLRTLGGSQPRGAPFAGVPSLAALKEHLHNVLANAFGVQGYVVLRQRLFDRSDADGFVRQADVVDVLRNDLQLSSDDVNDTALNAYIKNLITMKKDELHVNAFMNSLRPALPLKTKRRVIDAFAALGPIDGSIRLGNWLETLSDTSLKETVVKAFGAEGAEDMINHVPITEPVFLELISDLAALSDLESLLV